VLMSIRPYIRLINSSRYIEDLANGDICLAYGWSGDAMQSRSRAEEAGNGIRIAYRITHPEAMSLFDMLAIPADARHPHNALLFINFLMRPDIAAKNSSFLKYANANKASYPLLDKVTREDPGVYPSYEEMPHLHPNPVHSLTYTRMLNRLWTKFKAGQYD